MQEFNNVGVIEEDSQFQFNKISHMIKRCYALEFNERLHGLVACLSVNNKHVL